MVCKIPPRHNYSVNQGDIRFTGTVIDEAGIPVIGANILVKGTTNGTITDMDGRFTLINVPENAILVVSYIGYLTPKRFLFKGKNYSYYSIEKKIHKL